MPELSSLDDRILSFEATAPRARGAKEEAIRREMGLSPVRYYQRLNMLLDDPVALDTHPTLVLRLRRLRERHAG